jgi:nucleoid DNA-binding protein
MQELIARVAEEQGLSKAKTKRVLGALISTVNVAMSTGGSFRIPGLGTFKSTYKNPRVCRNPQNGEPINVAGRHAPKLTFARNAKRLVANANPEPIAANT